MVYYTYSGYIVQQDYGRKTPSTPVKELKFPKTLIAQGKPLKPHNQKYKGVFEIDNLKTKKCSKCVKEFPNTLEFFSKKGNKLRNICKECDKNQRKERLKKEKENFNKSRIVLNEDEEKMFTKKAKEFNMSRAEFLKLIILKAESETLVKIDPKCFDIFNAQIMGIATNINQIAYLCNSTKNVYKSDVENLKNELKKMREWQRKLEDEFNMIDTSIKYAHEVLTFDDI